MVEYLIHSGVKGQKWGVRRYQNPDGSLTPEGYQHYGIDPNKKRFLKIFDQISVDKYRLSKSVKKENKISNKERKKIVKDMLTGKYGEKKVKDLERDEKLRIGLSIAGVILQGTKLYLQEKDIISRDIFTENYPRIQVIHK